MTSRKSAVNLLDQLAEQYAERCRRGERPDLQECIGWYPELADEIRDLFPALVAREEGALGGSQSSNPDVTIELDDQDTTVVESVPKQIGDYLILGEIGRGGMGVVYEARQQSLRRRVALKVLPIHASQDRRALDRFRREARAAAQLHHTNIVPVFDVGQDGDQCFYAMQFIQGQPLDKVFSELVRLRSRLQPGRRPVALPLSNVALSLWRDEFARRNVTVSTPGSGKQPAPPTDQDLTEAYDFNPAPPEKMPEDDSADADAPDSSGSVILPGESELSVVESDRRHYFRCVARIGEQVAQALAYAHARGIVHRDIKPSNLVLDTAGVVWVTDFGLAKVEDDDLTRTDGLVGTLRYMSPERFRDECDGRADVYSLGVTLYEMLTLQPAFDSSDRLRLTEQISAREPPRPRVVDPLIPPDLETIVLKAMDKEPNGRYQSADGLREDLHRFLEDRPILARRISLVGRLVRWARRNKRIAVLTVAVALLLVGLAVSTALIARKQYQTDEALQRERRNNYGYQLSQAQEALELNQFRRAREFLAECPKEFRHWEWNHLWLQANIRQSHIVGKHAAAVNDVVVIADANLVISASTDGTVKAWKAGDGELVQTLLKHDSAVQCLVIANDGRHFVTGCADGRIDLWESKSLQRRATWDHGLEVLSVAVAPRGQWVVSGGNDGTLKMWHPEQRRPRLATQALTSPVTSIAINPDGSRIVTGGWEKRIKIWDAKTLGFLEELSVRPENGRALCFSPDGKHLVCAGCDDHEHSTLFLWDFQARTLRRQQRFKGHVNSVTFSPDGQRIAATVHSGKVLVWDTRTLGQTAYLSDHEGGAHGVTFNASGRSLISCGADCTLRAWDSSPTAVRRLRHSREPLRVIAFSPDGAQLASASKDGVVKIWDVETGKVVHSLPSAGNWVDALDYSPDGRTLVTSSGDEKLWFWDVASGRLMDSMNLPVSVWWLDVSPDGRRIVAGGLGPASKGNEDIEGHELLVVDAKTRNVIHCRVAPHEGAVEGAAFSPDGRYIASCGADGNLMLWDAETMKPKWVRAASANRCAVFSPDGKWIACGSMDGTASLWSVAEGKPVGRLSRHGEGITCLAFSPDQERIFSAARDGSVMVWMPDGTPLLTFRVSDSTVWHLAVSPDGKTLAASDGDGVITIWETAKQAKEVYVSRIDSSSPGNTSTGAGRSTNAEIAR